MSNGQICIWQRYDIICLLLTSGFSVIITEIKTKVFFFYPLVACALPIAIMRMILVHFPMPQETTKQKNDAAGIFLGGGRLPGTKIHSDDFAASGVSWLATRPRLDSTHVHTLKSKELVKGGNNSRVWRHRGLFGRTTPRQSTASLLPQISTCFSAPHLSAPDRPAVGTCK